MIRLQLELVVQLSVYLVNIFVTLVVDLSVRQNSSPFFKDNSKRRSIFDIFKFYKSSWEEMTNPNPIETNVNDNSRKSTYYRTLLFKEMEWK